MKIPPKESDGWFCHWSHGWDRDPRMWELTQLEVTRSGCRSLDNFLELSSTTPNTSLSIIKADRRILGAAKPISPRSYFLACL